MSMIIVLTNHGGDFYGTNAIIMAMIMAMFVGTAPIFMVFGFLVASILSRRIILVIRRMISTFLLPSLACPLCCWFDQHGGMAFLEKYSEQVKGYRQGLMHLNVLDLMLLWFSKEKLFWLFLCSRKLLGLME